MNKKIKIRFEMYEVGCIQGQDNSLFRLEELCESIDRMDLHDRYDDYFGDKVRLDYCQVDSINNQLYKLHFTRLRDDKISKTSIASLELANIDLEEGEYILVLRLRLLVFILLCMELSYHSLTQNC